MLSYLIYYAPTAMILSRGKASLIKFVQPGSFSFHSLDQEWRPDSSAEQIGFSLSRI